MTGDCSLYDDAGRPIAELRGLRAARLGRGDDAPTIVDTASWLYEIVWRPSPLAEQSVAGQARQKGSAGTPEKQGQAPTERGSWLILADRGGTGAALAAHLTKRGDVALLVTPGSRFEVPSDGCVTVDPTEPEHVGRALELLAGSGGPPVRGLVHLWSLDLPLGTDIKEADLDRIELLSCGSALHLVRAASRLEGAVWPRLWLVTRGAMAVGAAPGPVAVAQAPLWGLGRTIVHEQPALRCSAIDLDPGESPDRVSALLAELDADEDEGQVAYRDDSRYVARLVRAGRAAPVQALAAERAPEAFRLKVPAAPIDDPVLTFPQRDEAEQTPPGGHPPMVHPEATYLVTGGLGALGLTVAGWLVEGGARTLVLMSRRPPSAEAQRAVDSLAQGARVEVVAADVAREDDVRSVLRQIRTSLPPLRGIIHAAGVLDGGPVADLTLAQLRSVMGPKVRGTRHLHALTSHDPLDFFVLFSSVTSVLGSPGQSNYAAANAFLDAVAHDRRLAGKPALSINWGAWAEAGMAARIADGGWKIPDGIDSIAPRDGLDVLGRLMSERRTQVTVVPIDWDRLRQFAGPAADHPLVGDLMTGSSADVLGTSGRVDLTAIRRLASAERQARLEEYLELEVARVLQRSRPQVERDRPLTMLGLDSLTGLVLKTRVEADLVVTLPMSSLATGPTISELAAELADLALDAHASAREGVR